MLAAGPTVDQIHVARSWLAMLQASISSCLQEAWPTAGPSSSTAHLPSTTTLLQANQDYVPPMGKGSLYLRPLLLGSGPILGLGPAPSYTFTIFGAAVGAYFKVCRRGSTSALHVCISTLWTHSVLSAPFRSSHTPWRVWLGA